MANLNGQYLDNLTFYKGLINIGSTVGQNISSSLQSLTDGDGNNLPIQVSTTQVSIGDATGAGRLTVRGDGTKPTARFENNAGVVQFNIDSSGRIQIGEYQPYHAKLVLGGSDATFVIARTNGDSAIVFNASATEIGQIRSISGTGLRLQCTQANTSSILQGSVTTGAVYANRFTNSGNFTGTSGEQGLANIAATFAAAAGSANFRPLSINYTINNSGAQTGTMTGIFLNATETNLNGMTHNLMDLQVGGVSRFKINNAGDTVIGHTSASARLHVRGDGTNPIARFENNAGTARMIINDNGRINMGALPTSSAGLSSGDLWNNGGVLNIV